MIHLKEFATQADYEAFVAGGMAKPNVSLVNEPYGVFYNKYVELGVFIQHIDGTLYKGEEWSEKGFARSEANGIAIIDERASFVLAKVDESSDKSSWLWPYEYVEGVAAADSVEAAYLDYAGYNNTAAFISKYEKGAMYKASQYVFPNGKNGYLPSAGEWKVVKDNYSKVTELLGKVGTNFRLGENYVTSTQKDNSTAYFIYIGSSYTSISTGNKGNDGYVRAAMRLEL